MSKPKYKNPLSITDHTVNIFSLLILEDDFVESSFSPRDKIRLQRLERQVNKTIQLNGFIIGKTHN